MDLIYQVIIVLIVAIVLIALIIKFFKKIMKIVGIIIIIIGILLFLLFGTNLFNLNELNVSNVKYNFSIHDLKNKYCLENMNFRDSIKCHLIITPIYQDILNNYSEEELEKMKLNKFKMLVAIKQSVKNKKTDIHEKLKEINALYLWNDFNSDFSSGNLLEE